MPKDTVSRAELAELATEQIREMCAKQSELEQQMIDLRQSISSLQNTLSCLAQVDMEDKRLH